MKQENKKPLLNDHITLDDFNQYYWSKAELMAYCKRHAMAVHGLKEDLIERIKYYLKTGKVISSIKVKISDERDSDNTLTLDTLVKHYKNDVKTKAFFTEHIGKQFHFNDYLRQFRTRDMSNNNSLTYGDLIKGWLEAEAEKKAAGKSHKIGKQFEYNQFTRDFFMHEKGKTRKDAIAAWNFIKELPGERSYQRYSKLKLKL